MNGQERRQELVALLFEELPIQAIVETGTFRGTTTEYFAKLTKVPVYTVEADHRLYGFSWIRLKKFSHVHLFQTDSRVALQRLAQDDAFPKGSVFFYLDAHWGEDLPLAEELEQIFSNWHSSWVYIDDFKVEGDDGYSYDDYGPGKALMLDYIDEIIQRYQVSVFFQRLHPTKKPGRAEAPFCSPMTRPQLTHCVI
ncbi:MAG: hypothetical protein R3F37_06965 [Candidatus Competibacteraceae bacterium]